MSTSLRVFTVLVLALSASVLPSCNSTPDPTAGCTVVLRSSAADQMAFQMAFVDAANGADICVMPGTYHFTDSIAMASRTGVTFRGLGAAPGDVVLDFQTMSAGERGVSFTNMIDITVSNLTIMDATHDDLYFQSCNGVQVDHVVAGWANRAQAGAYAIYPVQSMNVVLDHCEAFGSADAGLYVGQTTNCVVSNSLVHGNVAGLEIENSINCEVFGNTATDNTGGILVFELPGLPAQGHTTSVHDNVSTGNNRANFAVGGVVQYVPVGIGMMIMAAHEVEIEGNTLSNNGTVGILLVDYQTAVIAGAPASTDPMYDGHLRHIHVHDNMQSGNSQMPDSAVEGLAQLADHVAVDVLWDMFVAPDDMPPQLCIRTSGSFRGIDGPNAFATRIDEVPAAAASCMTPVLPPVSL